MTKGVSETVSQKRPGRSRAFSRQMILILLRSERSGYNRVTDFSYLTECLARDGRSRRVVQASLTRTLNRLERMGLIKRLPSFLCGFSGGPKGACTKQIGITDKGWETLTTGPLCPIVNLLLVGAAAEEAIGEASWLLYGHRYVPGTDMLPPWLENGATVSSTTEPRVASGTVKVHAKCVAAPCSQVSGSKNPVRSRAGPAQSGNSPRRRLLDGGVSRRKENDMDKRMHRTWKHPPQPGLTERMT
jgi:hypothetical protein